MRILTLKEFKEHYQKYGRCVNDLQKRNSKLTEVGLKTRYDQYLKSEQKREERQQRVYEKQRNAEIDYTDEAWENVKLSVAKRDNYQCQFIKILSDDEYRQLVAHVKRVASGGFLVKIDPAHIYPKGSYPHMKYDEENVVLINRFVHSLLDVFKDPLTGEMITATKRLEWFEKVVGKERMKSLYSKSLKQGITFKLNSID